MVNLEKNLERKNVAEMGEIVVWNNKKVVYLEHKRTWWLGFDYERNCIMKFKGVFYGTNRLDNEQKLDYLDSIQKKRVTNMQLTNKLHSLPKGTKFIGNDGREYVFHKMIKTRFEFGYNDKFAQFTAKPQFIKQIVA